VSSTKRAPRKAAASAPKKRARPRSTATIGSSTLNASDLRGLRLAYHDGRLIPFLGAGVSLEYGIPAWKDLVVGLLFQHSQDARILRTFPPSFRRALAEWLTDYIEYDLTIWARVVKNTARKKVRRRSGVSAEQADHAFIDRLREQLYPEAPVRPKGETTLSAIADLIAEGASQGLIPAVVTFNYDDLLENELTRRNVPHYPVWSHRQTRGRGLPILHPHGFLPRKGTPPDAGVVFSEDEYHRVSGTVFHWAVEDVVHHLRHHSALFLGLSMSDPNLRRLLDASYVRGEIPAHWQVQRRKTIPRAAMFKAAEDIARRAVKEEADEAHTGLERMAEALRIGLKLAERFDRELHQSMGVKTIWMEHYGDIPGLLKAIRG
jgi:hypothetical protein